MDYFKNSITYVKKNLKKSILIRSLDIVFYLLFIPLFGFWLELFFRSVQKMPLQLIGAAMQSLELEAMQSLQVILLKVLLGIFGSVFLFFLLVLLNIALFKGITWALILKKKINYMTLFKSLLMCITMAVLFVVPFFNLERAPS